MEPQTPFEPNEIAEYGTLIDSAREALDLLAGARPTVEAMRELRELVAGSTRILGDHQVPEDESVYGRLSALPSRGQLMTPLYEILELANERIVARVRFGRAFLGGGAAAHGGTIPLLVDELFGVLINASTTKYARTASLKVDYRAVTPLDEDLVFEGRVDSVEGRKMFLVGELRRGDVVCAETSCLFVKLREDQA